MSIGYILKELLLYLFFILIEVKLLFLLEISSIKPSIFVVFFILKSLRMGSPKLATTCGFFSGLMLDLFNSSYMGLSSLLFSIMGFIVGYIGEKNEKLTKTKIFIYSFIIILFHVFSYYSIKGMGLTYYNLCFTIIIPTVCYTSLLQALVTYFFPYKKKKKTL